MNLQIDKYVEKAKGIISNINNEKLEIIKKNLVNSIWKTDNTINDRYNRIFAEIISGDFEWDSKNNLKKSINEINLKALEKFVFNLFD